MKKIFSFSISAGIFFCIIFSGCMRTNVYIDNIESYRNIPTYKVPVKFYIQNDTTVSNYCVQNYPQLFTADVKEAVPIKVIYPWSLKKASIHKGDGDLFTALLSLCSFGILPGIDTANGQATFAVCLPTFEAHEKLSYKVLSLANAGPVGVILPSCQLLPSWGAVLSGGKTTVPFTISTVDFNQKYLDSYCRIFIHLLSTVPEEKIERLYFSQLVSPIKLLK